MNLYAVSPKQSKWQEQTLLPLILSTYNYHSPSQRIVVKPDVTFFHRLCRMSPKYQREHAERVFSNALTAQRGEVHLGTVFHLAEAMGVTVSKEVVVNSRTGTRSTAGTVPQSFTHVRTDNKVNDDEMAEEGKEELLYGSEPQHPLPTFPEAGWPEFLQRIIKAGGNMIQHDIMLLGALTALGACMSRYVRCLYGGKYHHPSLQCFVVAPSASGKGILSYIRLLVELSTTRFAQKWQRR